MTNSTSILVNRLLFLNLLSKIWKTLVHIVKEIQPQVWDSPLARQTESTVQIFVVFRDNLDSFQYASSKSETNFPNRFSNVKLPEELSEFVLMVFLRKFLCKIAMNLMAKLREMLFNDKEIIEIKIAMTSVYKLWLI